MSAKVHKLFLTRCGLQENRTVSASDCEACPLGSVIDARSRVICSGQTRFFSTPCYYGIRPAATVCDCEDCRFGEVGPDRASVICQKPL
ncbi:MAG: hypothetical protein JSV90_09000 [Methanobacteriota archaeon]|nr:MAG: hypothetical protein JSV90_09000 [Euryarchaeota archaeon]